MANSFKQKILLHCCNFIFLMCGLGTLIAGIHLFSDTKSVLLSRLLAVTSQQLNDLSQPLFYYISFGLIIAGIIGIFASMVGFWAFCLDAYCCLSLYFFIVVLLLLAESVVCLAITLWPDCLGINLDESKMVKVLQGSYGVPGKEQFTLATDLAQSRFSCCGINSDINYDTSLWRLQGYGDLAVPLTCCILENANEKTSYLDPKPINETQCQTLQKADFEKHRHTNPCFQHLDQYFRETYRTFLIASIFVALVEFCVIFTIMSEYGMRRNNQISERIGKFPEICSKTKSTRNLVENIYEPEIDLSNATSSRHVRDIHGDEELKEIYVQPADFYKSRHNTSFKPNQSHYYISSRSYLV